MTGGVLSALNLPADAPVSMDAFGWIRFVREDFPTPEGPASTVVRLLKAHGPDPSPDQSWH